PHLLLAGVGDVTGKGSSAALDMARLTTQIELAASRCTPESFSTWLVELNNVLYQAMHADDNAVALTALLFDTADRRVYAAAFVQHPPPGPPAAAQRGAREARAVRARGPRGFRGGVRPPPATVPRLCHRNMARGGL